MNRRRLELFICRCPPCANFLDEVELAAARDHDLEVLNALEEHCAERVKAYGIRLLPSLVIDRTHLLEGVPDGGLEPSRDRVEWWRSLARPLPRRQP